MNFKMLGKSKTYSPNDGLMVMNSILESRNSPKKSLVFRCVFSWWFSPIPRKTGWETLGKATTNPDKPPLRKSCATFTAALKPWETNNKNGINQDNTNGVLEEKPSLRCSTQQNTISLLFPCQKKHVWLIFYLKPLGINQNILQWSHEKNQALLSIMLVV